MSKNVFAETDSFRRLLIGAAGGYALQGHREAAEAVMHVVDALDELTTGGKGKSRAPDDVEEQACMDRDYIADYLRCKGCGWHISDLKIYDHSRPLSDFTRLRATKFGYEPVRIEHPPQSWFYVEEKP
jgi:hypothetical protein